MGQSDRSTGKVRSSYGAETGFALAKLTGAFERYRQAVPEERVTRMLAGQAAFSRDSPFSAWIVMWLIIFQRLDPKGTLSIAVREMVTGPVRAFVRRPEEVPEPLSANTSAYSQARAKLPLEVAEKVSDWIFESLQQQAKTLPGWSGRCFCWTVLRFCWRTAKPMRKLGRQRGISMETRTGQCCGWWWPTM